MGGIPLATSAQENRATRGSGGTGRGIGSQGKGKKTGGFDTDSDTGVYSSDGMAGRETKMAEKQCDALCPPMHEDYPGSGN